MQTWDITRTLYKVSDFVSWQRSSQLVLTPTFQRRNVWKPGAKSYFIDTLVRGLPVPIIFLRDRKASLTTFSSTREVVDGQQRIRTVLAYISSSLLPDFTPGRDDFVVEPQHNKEIAGKQFSGLPDSLKTRILDYEFSVHVLPAGIGDREVLQIFARMNSTGVKLNPQELRNAAWFGELKTSVYELALEQLPRWQTWKIFSNDNLARMDEVEMISEFALLIVRGLTSKSQKLLDDLYKDKDSKFAEKGEVEKRIRSVMDAIETAFGPDIRVLGFSKKTLFFSLFAVVYDEMYGIGSTLARQKPSAPSVSAISRIRKAALSIQKGTAPQAVLDAAARRTTHLSSRKEIVGYLQK